MIGSDELTDDLSYFAGCRVPRLLWVVMVVHLLNVYVPSYLNARPTPVPYTIPYDLRFFHMTPTVVVCSRSSRYRWFE
jgi:hypothetical protein